MRGRLIVIRRILLLLLLFAITVSISWASEKSCQVRHDDVLTAIEDFLSNHEIYKTIPHRLYTKRYMDTVECDKEMEVRIVDRSRDKLLKSDNFQVAIVSGGKTLRRFELKTYIGIEVPIAVARCDIKRGERIDGLYEFRWCDLTGSSVRTPIYEGEDISGRVVRVTLRGGRELDLSMLEEADLVKRGEKVVVMFSSGRLALTMSGRALENGKLGDRVKVLNESSGKTIVGEVTGEGQVRVEI